MKNNKHYKNDFFNHYLFKMSSLHGKSQVQVGPNLTST